MANIIAGYADNPYLSRAEAQKQLAQSIDSLQPATPGTGHCLWQGQRTDDD